jgi:valyl-tRNA synthetase
MNASSIEFVEGGLPKSWVAANTGTAMIGFNLEDAVDFAEEREKWRKERNALDAYIVSTSKKLENKEFLEKAPQKVINEMQNKCVEANARRIWLEERINAIKETH